VNHPSRCRRSRLWILALGLCAALAARADAVSAVQLLREGGCGGMLPPAPLLHRNASLDHAAALWAAGQPPASAAERSGYRAAATAALHISGPEAHMIALLERSGCRTLLDAGMRDIGVYRRGPDHWLVLASAYVVPARAQAPLLATRVLQLVNEARAAGTRCGAHEFGPAPPVTLSATLTTVALGHAADMADHDYFEHADRSGRSPADRVRAVGYQEKLVGENIAYGPISAEEVVQGWLGSPGHCENIMDSRFAEMGIAYAPGHASKHGLYWVQLLAARKDLVAASR
jgi:uncharacterized protein YkwD